MSDLDVWMTEISAQLPMISNAVQHILQSQAINDFKPATKNSLVERLFMEVAYGIAGIGISLWLNVFMRRYLPAWGIG